MEMEVEIGGEDGSKFALAEGDTVLFGRGYGFNTTDRTVSRRHVLFQLNNTDSESEPRVSFEVIGRNPIWVWTEKEPAVRLFRKCDKGVLEIGDRFCLSGKAPVCFHLKGSELQVGKKKNRGLGDENEFAESSVGELDFEDMDISGIDPIKEFGFVMMGHEFDHYPKGMIRNVTNWEWFLEESCKHSEDEEDFGDQRKEMRRKRKKGRDNEDDEWTGEGEDDKDLVANMRKGMRAGYSTRSKDSKGPTRARDTNGSGNSKRKKATSFNETVEDEEEEDDDDETLGGFIVDDEEEGQEEVSDEEEFEEGEEDDDDGVED